MEIQKKGLKYLHLKVKYLIKFNSLLFFIISLNLIYNLVIILLMDQYDLQIITVFFLIQLDDALIKFPLIKLIKIKILFLNSNKTF